MIPITASEGLFYVFAFGMVAFASMVISTQRSIHSIFYLIATFLNAAGLLLSVGLEFLSFIIVIVYVGAVAVLFLFVVMMINTAQESNKHWKQPIFFTAGILTLEGFILGSVAYYMPWRPLECIKTNGNIKDLGYVLYTDYFLAFQLVGLILFVSVIGVVLLTLRQRRHVHRQNISAQLKRSPENSLELKDIDLGRGL